MSGNIWLMLVVFLSLAVLVLVLIKLAGRKPYPRIYKPKGDFLLSPGEKRFFDALFQSISEDMYICPKVRVADVIVASVPNTDPDFWRYYNAINQKHVDFVVVRRKDFHPLCIVELDGGSHKDPARRARDNIVDAAFEVSIATKNSPKVLR